MMLPKFTNPHSLMQDAVVTTRSEIARQVECTCVVDDEKRHSLKRDLDNLLQDTWADALAQTFSPRKVKRQKTAESHTEDGQPVFRLVSSMKRPQQISLDPKPLPLPVTREPECEDDERQAEVRGIRAQSVAVEFKNPGEMGQINPKPVTVETKIALANAPLPRRLPPLLVIEEVRATKRVRARHLETSGISAASPHEPQMSCVVLPVKSTSDNGETQKKKCRKGVTERPAPAYWRPSPDMRGKCMGYALGYPSSWAPDQLYVRDTIKRGVQST